jgi:hypothetical protein
MNYNTRAGNNLFDVRELLLDVLPLKVANFEQAISKRNDAPGKLATFTKGH